MMASAIWAASATAETLTPIEIPLVLKLFEVTGVLPLPSWQKTDNPLDESETSRKQEGAVFITEFIPKGETFESWTQMYAVFAIRDPRANLNSFMDRSISPYLQACGRENLGVQPLARDPHSALIVLSCRNSPQGPERLGYGDGVGELSLMWFGRYQQTLVKVYQHWRGAAFSPTDPATWPVSEAELREMTAKMAQIQLVPN